MGTPEEAPAEEAAQVAWVFCEVCKRKGPVPECRLCEQLNGRLMSRSEAATLREAICQAELRRLPADWILDVPFADGTTPRERRQS